MEYVERLFYTEVTHVPADGQWTNPEERLLDCFVCGTPTKHVRLTDGWMCGCGFFVEIVKMVDAL